jgi:hypothetical protein
MEAARKIAEALRRDQRKRSLARQGSGGPNRPKAMQIIIATRGMRKRLSLIKMMIGAKEQSST